jgi:hypothetical protein
MTDKKDTKNLSRKLQLGPGLVFSEKQARSRTGCDRSNLSRFMIAIGLNIRVHFHDFRCMFTMIGAVESELINKKSINGSDGSGIPLIQVSPEYFFQKPDLCALGSCCQRYIQLF